MTRVALVAYDDSPPLGGQGVMVEGMRAALERRGVGVDTISGRGDHAIAYPSVLHRAPLDLSLFLNTHPRTLVRSGPDVVHAHGGPGGVSILRRAPVPLVYTAHHTYRQAHKRGTVQRLPAPLEARSYRLARLVLPVSPSTADAVRAMGIAAERIEVVPPGVAIPAAGEGLREPARVLFVGRLEPLKGVLEAVEVMRRLIEERPQVTGAIVGSGSLANQVRAHIAKLPAIEYLGDLDRTAVQREYARAALLLMPSRYEGLGLVALEAQASTTPVVGYDVDGLRDSVVDGGVLVAPGDVAAMHRAAIALLDDPQRRAELGERGREFVRARHSWERITARLEEIYTALAAA